MKISFEDDKLIFIKKYKRKLENTRILRKTVYKKNLPLSQNEQDVIKKGTQKSFFYSQQEPPWFRYFRKIEKQILTGKVIWFYGQKPKTINKQLKEKLYLLGCNYIKTGTQFNSYHERYKAQNVYVIQTQKWKDYKKSYLKGYPFHVYTNIYFFFFFFFFL